MGNVLGCVQGQKEECNVDPKKAPLSPGSKEGKGRRYFQRKKRKSGHFQPAAFLVSREGDAVTHRVVCGSEELELVPEGVTEEPQAERGKPTEVETHLSRSHNISSVIDVREGPDLMVRDALNRSLCKSFPYQPRRIPIEQTDGDRSRVDVKLRGVTSASKAASAKDGLLARKLLQRQLRRAVSFGAVEHVLDTLRGKDGPGSEESFAKIILGSETHRRSRRRAYTCSGDARRLPVPARAISTEHEVNLDHVTFRHRRVIHHELVRGVIGCHVA